MSDNYYKEKYKEYKDKYYQEKNKKEDERKHKNDGCQPIVNVNVNCDDNKKESGRPSAFRAVNNSVEQMVTADVPVIPVLYPDEIFDLNNEYDPDTSAFTPKQDGVYLVIASVNFFPTTPTDYRVLTLIRVNGIPVVSDNDFFGDIPIGDVTSVSAILPLKAGDVVNVAASVSTDGTILPNPFASPTHFEAARFPSPDHLFGSFINNNSGSNINTTPDPKNKI